MAAFPVPDRGGGVAEHANRNRKVSDNRRWNSLIDSYVACSNHRYDEVWFAGERMDPADANADFSSIYWSQPNDAARD